MPIYEYACPDCGHEFETMQKVSAPRLTDCPECEGEQLRKKVSATSFSLKGSGWYKDHYGLKPSGGSGAEGSSSASSSEKAGSSESTAASSAGDSSSTSSSSTGSKGDSE